ncbi:MAG: hypothetical protein JSR60_12785 [Proteobacteria bacterium]|nr:hypothetical protein [Pseudomonadota bacterium]
MAPRSTAKAAKTLSKRNTPSRRKALQSRSLLQSPVVQIVAVSAGVVGLAALGIALFGPRRFRDEVLIPINRSTVTPLIAAATPPAERAWDEIRPLRDRLGRVLAAVNTDEVRQAFAQRLADWFGRYN